MKVSELVRDLAELIADHGDLELRVMLGDTDYYEREIDNAVMVEKKADKIELTVFGKEEE